jgi:hypothetical protein
MSASLPAAGVMSVKKLVLRSANAPTRSSSGSGSSRLGANESARLRIKRARPPCFRSACGVARPCGLLARVHPHRARRSRVLNKGSISDKSRVPDNHARARSARATRAGAIGTRRRTIQGAASPLPPPPLPVASGSTRTWWRHQRQLQGRPSRHSSRGAPPWRRASPPPCT